MAKMTPEEQEHVEELVGRAQNGDTGAFGDLYDSFVKSVYRYIYYRVPLEEVEDMVETVFLKIWENLRKYKRRKNNFSAWVFRVTHNLIVDFYRTRKEETLELDLQHPDEERIHSPLRFTQNQLNQKYLKEALEKLNEQYQQIIVLKFINELSNKEISEITGKNEGALRILQFRALRALRDVLSRMGIEP